jgi:hypothetical protein
MKTLSDGSESTLKTYLAIAELMFGDEAAEFIREMIATSPNGEHEEVIADERQMLMLLASFCQGKQE